MPAYLFILVMLAVIWFFLIRPRQRSMREQQRQVAALEVGDEIVTAGGLYGTVKRIENGELQLEIAPQVVAGSMIVLLLVLDLFSPNANVNPTRGAVWVELVTESLSKRRPTFTVRRGPTVH